MKTNSFILIFLFIFITGCALSGSHLERGRYYLDKQKYEKAVHELEKAANEKGDIYHYINAYTLLGEAYSSSGNSHSAVSVYRTADRIIHLKIREISARRIEIRRALNTGPDENLQLFQEEDLSLAEEEHRLKEKEKEIKGKIKHLMRIQ